MVSDGSMNTGRDKYTFDHLFSFLCPNEPYNAQFHSRTAVHVARRGHAPNPLWHPFPLRCPHRTRRNAPGHAAALLLRQSKSGEWEKKRENIRPRVVHTCTPLPSFLFLSLLFGAKDKYTS